MLHILNVLTSEPNKACLYNTYLRLLVPVNTQNDIDLCKTACAAYKSTPTQAIFVGPGECEEDDEEKLRVEDTEQEPAANEYSQCCAGTHWGRGLQQLMTWTTAAQFFIQ